ncbi:MAG: helix-turn-helix domain-containing protein [Paludibacter sp.]|nr:helix-turn-helix domain-containing protein [Paludibacter sp.]
MEKEKVLNVVKKISQARIRKGYSYENMAAELAITAAAYRKIEIGSSKLSVERLFRISEILESPLTELLDMGNEIFNQTNNESATGYQQKIENFYQENKEVYEKLLAAKDGQIEWLKNMLEKK